MAPLLPQLSISIFIPVPVFCRAADTDLDRSRTMAAALAWPVVWTAVGLAPPLLATLVIGAHCDAGRDDDAQIFDGIARCSGDRFPGDAAMGSCWRYVAPHPAAGDTGAG